LKDFGESPMNYFVIPIPLNKEGKGPEMDPKKVVETDWEIWDEELVCISSHPTEEVAIAERDRLMK